jgi:hypothetical protein
LEPARSDFKDLGFPYYLGGYIGSRIEQELWVKEKASLWTSVVTDLAFAALSHLQTALAGLQKSLQQEW